MEVPDDATVILPAELPGLADQPVPCARALERPLAGPPLAELAAGAPPGGRRLPRPDPAHAQPHRAATRCSPSSSACGVPDAAVTLLCATGTHRQATPAEMGELVGPEIVARYAIVDHDARGRRPRRGRARSTARPILLQRDYVEADVRIITGFVEPHFFAGFSGGPKAVCPGLAATETILEAHHPRRIADADATFVTRRGQPGARLRPRRGGAGSAAPLARCGDQPGPSGHRRLRRPARGRRTTPPARSSSRRRCSGVAAPFDVVVSTNGGHPLDRNLYQAVKGMAAAERIVRHGGIIVMAAACRRRHPGRRRLRRRALAGPHAPTTWSTPPAGPSSTAGRPRCWVGCCSGPRCGSTARA